jgi:hypothetical protein
MVRIREGGEVLERIDHDRTIFAAMVADQAARRCSCWRPSGAESRDVDEAIAARTGQVLIMEAPAPGAGWP